MNVAAANEQLPAQIFALPGTEGEGKPELKGTNEAGILFGNLLLGQMMPLQTPESLPSGNCEIAAGADKLNEQTYEIPAEFTKVADPTMIIETGNDDGMAQTNPNKNNVIIIPLESKEAAANNINIPLFTALPQDGVVESGPEMVFEFETAVVENDPMVQIPEKALQIKAVAIDREFEEGTNLLSNDKNESKEPPASLPGRRTINIPIQIRPVEFIGGQAIKGRPIMNDYGVNPAYLQSGNAGIPAVSWELKDINLAVGTINPVVQLSPLMAPKQPMILRGIVADEKNIEFKGGSQKGASLLKNMVTPEKDLLAKIFPTPSLSRPQIVGEMMGGLETTPNISGEGAAIGTIDMNSEATESCQIDTETIEFADETSPVMTKAQILAPDGKILNAENSLSRSEVSQGIPKEAAPVRFVLPPNVGRGEFKNHRTIVIKLEPEHLGQIRLTMVHQNDTVSGRLVVQNPEARMMVESNIDKLYDQLSRQGINLDSFQVTLGGNQGDYRFSQGRTDENAVPRHSRGDINESDGQKDLEAAAASTVRGGMYISAAGVNWLM